MPWTEKKKWDRTSLCAQVGLKIQGSDDSLTWESPNLAGFKLWKNQDFIITLLSTVQNCFCSITSDCQTFSVLLLFSNLLNNFKFYETLSPQSSMLLSSLLRDWGEMREFEIVLLMTSLQVGRGSLINPLWLSLFSQLSSVAIVRWRMTSPLKLASHLSYCKKHKYLHFFLLERQLVFLTF